MKLKAPNFLIVFVALLSFGLGQVSQVRTVEAASPGLVTAVGQITLGQVDITDAEAIRYVNEVIRPTMEQMRGMDAEIDAALVTWFAGINAKITNDSSPILDGREDEGVSRLVGTDINNSVTQMLAFQAQMNQAGVADVISKPCVQQKIDAQ